MSRKEFACNPIINNALSPLIFCMTENQNAERGRDNGLKASGNRDLVKTFEMERTLGKGMKCCKHSARCWYFVF